MTALFQARNGTLQLTGLFIAACLLMAGPIANLNADARSPKVAGMRLSQSDTAYAYASKVFSKLQNDWERLAGMQAMPDTLIRFTLRDDGTVMSVRAQNGQGNTADPLVQDFVRNNAPFGPFPDTLKGNQLRFEFQLSNHSLQMLSYSLDSSRAQDSVITYYASPTAALPGASLYYMVAEGAEMADHTIVQDDASSPVAFVQQGSAVSDYINGVEADVRAHWQLPEGAFSPRRAMAQLLLDRNGNLLSGMLTQSSGNALVDQSIRTAIEQAAPFPPVPPGAPSFPLEIEYVFEPVAPEPGM